MKILYAIGVNLLVWFVATKNQIMYPPIHSLQSDKLLLRKLLAIEQGFIIAQTRALFGKHLRLRKH